MIKNVAVGVRSLIGVGKIHPLLLFLAGLGFMGLGLRVYPAFIAVGCLFLIVGYRGYTCFRNGNCSMVSIKTEDTSSQD